MNPILIFFCVMAFAACIGAFIGCKSEVERNAMEIQGGIFLFPINPPDPGTSPSQLEMSETMPMRSSIGTPSGSAAGSCMMGDADPIGAFHSKSNELGA